MHDTEEIKITMTVRDFVKVNMDIDVYDDVCEELGIAFCGPMMLTIEGERHFAEVLDYEVEISGSGKYQTAVIHIDGDDGNGWKKRLRKAEEFFYAAAGYCNDSDYQRWFIDPGFGQYCTDPSGMMDVVLYKDETPWYTEGEMNVDNVTEMSFPRKMVQEFYVRKGNSILTFVEWYTEEYTADDTIGLFDFCKARGFIAVRED